MSKANTKRIVELLADGGFAAEKPAVDRIRREDDPQSAVTTVLAHVDQETITVTKADVDRILGDSTSTRERRPADALSIEGDMTGQSTGTGSYADFLSLFRDRYDRLQEILSNRVRARSMSSLAEASHRHSIGVIGMISDVRSTTNGHWLIELDDRTGNCRCLVHRNSDLHEDVPSLLLDEVIAIEGTLSDDGGVIFVEQLYHPDVPRSNESTTADRHVEVALVSDIHVGSQEFAVEGWNRFTDWLDSDEAEAVEYLLIAGDLVEGVGVYPGQSEELAIVDVYEQYEAAAERLKDVPGRIEIALIPGNHDAVRLAEPQPGFDDELQTILSANDPTILSNPGVLEVEGVSFLLYHGTSLDQILADLPADIASYAEPERAMVELLRRRHLAPPFGFRTRIAPEERDHLVIDQIPDVFHAGHVHTLGVGVFRDVRVVNSGCWQHQTPFQRKVGIDPDVCVAPIVDLRTLDVSVRKFL